MEKQREFRLLDKNLERCLRIVLSKAKDQNTEEIIFISHKDMEKLDLEQLRNKGFVEVGFNPLVTPFESICKLTYHGKHYFELKRQYKKSLRRPKIWEWVRYGITTLIALAALAVSIIALFAKAQ